MYTFGSNSSGLGHGGVTRLLAAWFGESGLIFTYVDLAYVNKYLPMNSAGTNF